MFRSGRLIVAHLMLFVGSLHAQSFDVGGMSFATSVSIAEHSLMLNGAGLRTRFGFRVYAAALYVLVKSTGASDLIGQPGPKRFAITMMREVEADTFAKSFNDGLKSNLTDSELLQYQERISQFDSIFRRGGTLKRGDVIFLDLGADESMRLSINGQTVGEPIKGADFFSAVLKIWLGDRPVDGSLRKSLLGEN